MKGRLKRLAVQSKHDCNFQISYMYLNVWECINLVFLHSCILKYVEDFNGQSTQELWTVIRCNKTANFIMCIKNCN